MRVSIHTKFLVLCIILVLITTIGISTTYYMLTKQDKQRESRQRFQIAFDIILKDFAKRVNTYTTSVNQFLQENITLLWAAYTYSLDSSEHGTILFFFDQFTDVAQELKQFGRVALADRVMFYGANKRLLVLYQRKDDRETMGGYLVSEKEGPRYLPMDHINIQAELTFRRNNLAINARNKELPDTPLPPGVMATYAEDIPDAITFRLFRQGQQLGIRMVAPISRRTGVPGARRKEKIGILVGEVLFTQEMVAEYSALSKTDVNFFAGNQLSIGTLREQLVLEEGSFNKIPVCQEILNGQQGIHIAPFLLSDHAYYQGRCALRTEHETIGAITVSLSQAIEQREIGKILQTVVLISLAGFAICIGLVSWLIVPRFTDPIITLTNTAFRMARGELDAHIETSGDDELGTLARSLAFLRDEVQRKIQELQQLNAELDRRVEDRTAELVRQTYILDTFMETVPDQIYFKDREGQITRANLAHARHKGLRFAAEELGKTDFDFFAPEEAHLKYAQEQAIIATGVPLIGVEERHQWPDGRTEWVLTTKMPLRNEHGEIIGIFGISRDITPLKQTEETLKHAKEAAEMANRAKSEFLANMNHELRTPLNVILGLTQIMARNAQIPADERENLEIIYRSGEHLLTLINTVLDLSKIEAGRMVLVENTVDLFRLLNELQEMFALKAAQKRLHLSFESAADVPQYIRTDATKLRQVLMNLLNNAVKFTEEGGITVRILDLGLKTLDREETQSTIKNLKFEIEDTGPGIAPDERDLIFEAFRQTRTGRKAQEGTGLGLTICQKFARLLGGEISVESELERGTTFRFTIPARIASAADTPAAVQSRRIVALEPGQPRYRILIVDDKPDNRLLFAKLLTPLGFELHEAANGQEAITIWNTVKPHLIWMDIRMPVLDGYEATRRIKATAQGQATIIIALTASTADDDRELLLAAGCNDLVHKPFREAEIFAMMHTHLGVRYVYEGRDRHDAQSENLQPLIEMITTTALHTLPPDLYYALQQAVNVTAPELMKPVIEQIRPQNHSLADALSELTRQFRFDILQRIFEESDARQSTHGSARKIP